MALQLKFDQEAALEFIAKYKDQLMLVVLTLVLLGGGWYVYTNTSYTMQYYINEATQTRAGGGGGGANDDAVDPNELVAQLTEKRERSLYQLERNPFGSPAEQMRMLEEVRNAYNQAVELYNQGQYQAAIEQFDRVISMDVAETRMNYPIQPSDYKQRAMRSYAQENLDQIISQAQNNIQQGDSALENGQRQQALDLFTQAYESLAEVREADPQGEAIGEDNLQQIDQLYREAYDKAMTIRGETLQETLEQDLANARQALNSQNYVEMLKMRARLVYLKQEINTVDPNANLISRTARNQIDTLISQIDTELQNNFDALVSQAKQLFQQGLADNDIQATQEAIAAMNQVLSVQPDQALAQEIQDFRMQRAELVVQEAESFIAEQNQLIQQENYDQFNPQKKARLMQDLTRLLEFTRSANNTSLNQQIGDVIQRLRNLSLPPQVTTDYEVSEIKKVTDTLYQITVLDKTNPRSPRNRKLIFSEGNTDSATQITLEQVDTDNGFVILSKPGYRDAQVSFNPNN